MAALKAAKPRTAGHPLVAPALDAMPQGVCIWDRSVRLAYCNAAFLRIYRVRAGAIRQHMTLLEVIEVLAAAGNYPGRSAADIASEYRAPPRPRIPV